MKKSTGSVHQPFGEGDAEWRHTLTLEADPGSVHIMPASKSM
jgi:hypothetical protein